MTTLPQATSFSSAPLRNRLRLELNAPVPEVWALVGDPARLPEYSSGVERVEVRKDQNGRPGEYVCHFRPHSEGEEGFVHREVVRWHEPNAGYASSASADNGLGLRNDVNLVALEPSTEGTILTWHVHFEAENLDLNASSYDAALADIGKNLVRRFGGRILERYVDGPLPAM
jgi:carbon monoxide dehydrogenase subunit G